MAGATTIHNEGYEDERRRKSEKANEVLTLYSSALNTILRQKYEEIEQLKRKVEEFNTKIGRKDKEIDGLRKRMKELEEEVRILKEKFGLTTKELTETQMKLKEVESKNNELEKKVKVLQGNRNILYLGEMCRRLQQNIYRYVFPDKIPISSLVSYKIKNIENDIDKSKKLTERERKDAKTRFEDIKQKLKLEKFIILIEEFQSLRNASAHPEITDDIKDDVVKAAEELNEQGVFEFMASFEDVNELIGAWKTTEDLVKKRK